MYTQTSLIVTGALLALSAFAHQDATEDQLSSVSESVRPASIAGHLSFIASDALRGRNTPSSGLDIAAEYIAAQFRRGGLEPFGEEGYFQIMKHTGQRRDAGDFSLTLTDGEGEDISIPADRVSLQGIRHLDIDGAPLFRIDLDDERVLSGIDEDGLRGAMVITRTPDLTGGMRTVSRDELIRARDFFRTLRSRGVITILNVDPTSDRGTGVERADSRSRRSIAGIPIVTLYGQDYEALRANYPIGDTGMRASLTVGETHDVEFELKNVVGVLCGSDPELQNTYVVVSAHYDHIGVRANPSGDMIYNGANDDASGTTTVIEIASALSALPEPPRRSIIFVCFFGEERGLIGSRHFVNSSPVPHDRIVANVNLEHMGRTDDSEGESLEQLFMTGYRLSDLRTRFEAAGSMTGVDIVHHPRNSMMFFNRSDNAAFAMVGIPAHTFCTSFIFPDYHGPGDHWELIDFDNMESVIETMALGVLNLANDPSAPVWDSELGKEFQTRQAGSRDDQESGESSNEDES